MPRQFKYPEFADPQVRPRYTGLPTFLRAPYQEDPAGLDIALVGVPFDGGVTNRTGARHGPREIRNQSSLIRKMNQATGLNPYESCKIADVGDAWAEAPFALEKSLDEIEKADAASLARLADFVSRSISTQSRALGSGSTSQSLTF